jgi:hypothetical protein
MVKKIGINNMKKMIFIVLVFLFGSCAGPNYVTIDEVYTKLTPPVELASKGTDKYGNEVYKVRDGRGNTYTCEDASLASVPPHSVIVLPPFEDVDKILMDLKSPVKVIGKDPRKSQLKLMDKNGKIVTVTDRTLENYNVGDFIK